jgi:dTDP-4-amino-4,6-dideoxygalactose transaminase
MDIEHILTLKHNVFERYNNGLKDYIQSGKIKLLKSESNTEISRWMYTLIIPGVDFNTIEFKFNEKQIQIRPFFYDVLCHKHLETIPCHELSKAPQSANGIMLPSYPELTKTEQEYIITCLKDFIDGM